jgi:hypothetical protein
MHCDAQLTSVVEVSEEVEGDVSMLLSRYFLFIARLGHAFQLAQASWNSNACSNTRTARTDRFNGYSIPLALSAN